METKWISVDERLPHNLEDVLAFEKYKDVPFVGFYRDGRWIANQDFVYSLSGVISSDIDSHNVTHWMPLPTPPKTKENK